MRSRIIALTVLVAGLCGCAELKKDLPPPTGSRADVHPEGWADTASDAFHGNAVRNAAWDMQQCQTCHGGDYTGGVVDVSCRTCHANVAGPENCATCHGSSNPAPPRDLSENTSSDLPGVGAHQDHLSGDGDLSSIKVACGECHMVPGSVYSLGHVDSDAPAELLFSGSLADIDPTSPFGQPAYEYSSTTCANTFCHGAWSLSKVSSPYPDAYTADEMFGDNFSPLWTGGEDQVDCGTCHGLPPAGHVPAELATCGDSGCHSGVVAPDGTIDDLSLHMNGKVNVNDTERPF